MFGERDHLQRKIIAHLRSIGRYVEFDGGQERAIHNREFYTFENVSLEKNIPGTKMTYLDALVAE